MSLRRIWTKLGGKSSYTPPGASYVAQRPQKQAEILKTQLFMFYKKPKLFPYIPVYSLSGDYINYNHYLLFLLITRNHESESDQTFRKRMPPVSHSFLYSSETSTMIRKMTIDDWYLLYGLILKMMAGNFELFENNFDNFNDY